MTQSESVNAIIAYEQGDLDEEQIIELFQYLVDSGLAWSLQGSYGRMAIALIDAGHVITNRKDKAMETQQTEQRTLRTIAHEIRRDWKNVNYAAEPYLSAMATLESVKDNYLYDSGVSIVLYFLSNARGWKGETAKRIKAELKAMVTP